MVSGSVTLRIAHEHSAWPLSPASRLRPRAPGGARRWHSAHRTWRVAGAGAGRARADVRAPMLCAQDTHLARAAACAPSALCPVHPQQLARRTRFPATPARTMAGPKAQNIVWSDSLLTTQER